MNARSRYTARSVSPLPRTSRRALVNGNSNAHLNPRSGHGHVRRTSSSSGHTTAALKNAGLMNYKEPSPTSTMHHSFDFDYRTDMNIHMVGDGNSNGNEPFDCNNAINMNKGRPRSRVKNHNYTNNHKHKHKHHAQPYRLGRPMSTGHIGRLEGTMHAPNSGISSQQREERTHARRYSGTSMAVAAAQQASASFTALPLRMPTPSNYRRAAPGGGAPTSPRKERFSHKNNHNSHTSSNPGSPQRASSFRQRRMQLAQERKWKEEQMERTVQYRTSSRTRSGSITSASASASASASKVVNTRGSASANASANANASADKIFAIGGEGDRSSGSGSGSGSGSAIGGKELVIPSRGPGGMGMEISITNHLQKEGSDTVIRRHSPHSHEYAREYDYDNHSHGSGGVLGLRPGNHAQVQYQMPLQAAKRRGGGTATATATATATGTSSCVTSDHEVSAAGMGDDDSDVHSDENDAEYVDSDVESMTIDTVSSLNTFQSEDAFSTSYQSARSWMMPMQQQQSSSTSKLNNTFESAAGGGSKAKHRKKNPNQSRSRGGRKNTGQGASEHEQGNDNLSPAVHPPMYVSSKKVRIKKSSVNTTNASQEVDTTNSNDSMVEEGEKRDEVAPLQLAITPEVKQNKALDESDIQNISDRSPFEKSFSFETANANTNVSLETPSPRTKTLALDATALASNKTQSRSGISSNQENDIPRLPNISMAAKIAVKNEYNQNPIRRQRPRSQSFQGSTSTDDLSAKALRRRRLQNYVSKNLQKDEAHIPSSASVPGDMAVNANKSINANIPVADEGINKKIIASKNNENVSSNVSPKPKLSNSHNESSMSNPFDESVGGQTACEEKLEEDLQNLADRRDKDFGLDDNNSVPSIRSSRSLYSLQSLRTCFTCEKPPASREELKRSIKRKKNRVHLIHHALTCTHPHPTNSDDPNYVPCPEVKHCHALSVLVAHVQTCTFTENGNGAICEVPGCHEYKKLWNHYRRCVLRTFTKPNNKRCKICSDVWKKYAFDLEASFESIASERNEQKVSN